MRAASKPAALFPKIERRIMFPWRAIFFAINVSVCLGWIAVAARFFEDSEGDGSAMFFCLLIALPPAAVGVAEVLLFTRRAPWLERPLGVLAGLVGAIALFGFLVNAAGAIRSHQSGGVMFWLVVGGGLMSIAAYAFWCCWLRVRRRTFADSQPRGFPIS